MNRNFWPHSNGNINNNNNREEEREPYNTLRMYTRATKWIMFLLQKQKHQRRQSAMAYGSLYCGFTNENNNEMAE